MNVLLIDDDADLIELITVALERDGHRVTAVRSAAEADDQLESSPFDLMVLELNLPDRSGLTVCREARTRKLGTPILVLTANAGVESRVRSLDAGADDFLAKPFAVAELRARVRALGRRTTVHAALTWTWRHGTTTLDFPRRRATVAGQEVQFTAKEWSILGVLAAADGGVVPRTRLLGEVWTTGEGGSASLDVLMTRIRKKLGSDAVRTLRGEGYALA